MMRRDCPGVVLDLDGTLVESAPDLQTALNVALRDVGRDAVALPAVKDMIGDGIVALVERGFAATGGPVSSEIFQRAVERCMQYYAAHSCDASHLFPGVMDTLKSLHTDGYVLAVCTNKPQTPAIEMLQHFGLMPLLSCVVGGDTFDVRKPHPHVLLRTIERMGINGSSVVMVGDSCNDLLLARGAEVPVVLVRFGYGVNALGAHVPDAYINHFDELPQALSLLAGAN